VTRATEVPHACPCMRARRIVPRARRTPRNTGTWGARGRRGYRPAPDACAVPPRDSGVQAIQLAPSRAGVAGPYPTGLLTRPAFPPCCCPLLLSDSGRVGRLEVVCLELRPPRVAIHSVRDTAHGFLAHGSSVICPLSWAPYRACDLHVGASPARVIHTSLPGVLTASPALLVPITYLSPSPRQHIRWRSQRHWLLGESHPVPYPVDTCSPARLRSVWFLPPRHGRDGRAVLNRPTCAREPDTG
jgi:hypothetical protein